MRDYSVFGLTTGYNQSAFDAPAAAGPVDPGCHPDAPANIKRLYLNSQPDPNDPQVRYLPAHLLAFAPMNRFYKWRLLVIEEKPKAHSGHTRFTTDYAIDWARKQGWKLIERERYDVRTRRHHDLMLGVDALFDSPDGMVGVQGAGLSERKEHFDRFQARGGKETGIRRSVRVVYLEFVRGTKKPKKIEWWISLEDLRKERAS